MKHLIIGYGQIGKLIDCLLEEAGQKTWHIDKGEGCEEEKFDFIHIAIPFNGDFVRDVNIYLAHYFSECVIIHSTVKPGTTEKIIHRNRVYSPVNGRHDNGFLNDVKQYHKYFGIENEAVRKPICEVFSSVGCEFVTGFRSLEFAKINCTNYTLYNVIFEKWLYDYCQREGLDFDFIYKQWNQNYNIGVRAGWERPIYDHMEGPVGGHCLVPNLELIDNEFTKMLKILGERWIK